MYYHVNHVSDITNEYSFENSIKIILHITVQQITNDEKRSWESSLQHMGRLRIKGAPIKKLLVIIKYV